MTALKEHADHVKAAVRAGADIIISGAGLPTDLPALTEGSSTKIAPIVSTDKSANVILTYWDRKYKRTADLVVIEGPEAGGHLGFKKEELAEYTPEAYGQEIQKIISTVKKLSLIHICRAGGIRRDRRRIPHHFAGRGRRRRGNGDEISHEGSRRGSGAD